jgi:diguanylate cyclase (GGDEF)-like protein
VDRFKLFNDNLGHLAGDQVLREVGLRLLACVRAPDVVARLSGDEFAILIENVEGAESACRVAERILDCFEAPVRIGDRDLQLSASIGVAISHARHQATDELLLDADVALYRAKSAGRKRYVLFDDSLQRSATNVFEIEQDLRRALNVGQFEPYFQPLVRLSTGETVGYEALIRWNHPERGMLLPGQFLSVAEDSGLMETIDWEMYRLACIAGRDLVRGDGFMTINISPRHFQDANFGERLLGLMALTGFDPSRLRIEVTESTLLGDPDAVAEILSSLQAAGVETALDDFGTGYSSLGYVNLFPLKMIKIDRSFIMPLGSESAHRSSAIVSAILALSERLGLEVLGEGVETEVQRQALIEMGCEFGQGVLFARPQPASHWLRMDNAVRQ